MRQKKLVMKLYKACINKNKEKQKDIYEEEFIKIFKRRASGKPFTPKWTIIR